MSLTFKRQFWSKIIYSPVTLGLLTIVAIMLSFSVYDRYTIERETAERLLQKQEELDKSKEREATLKEQVEYLSDDKGVESEIRKHFDVAKEGEKVVVLVDTPNEDNALISTTSESIAADTESFWSKWWPW